jgi:hypothetical protein
MVVIAIVFPNKPAPIFLNPRFKEYFIILIRPGAAKASVLPPAQEY